MFERSLRSVAQSVRISYPVPFLVTLLVVAGLVLFGMALIGSGWLVIVLAVQAILFLAGGLGIVIYCVFLRPTLLKSETYMLLDSLLIAGDSDMDAASRERLGARILDRLPEPHSERRGPLGGEQEGA